MSLFLLRYAHSKEDFRIPELEGIIHLCNAQVSIVRDISCDNSPFLVVKSKDQENIQKISERSILLKESSRILAYGSSLEDLHETLKRDISKFTHSFDPILLLSSSSFKFVVDTFGKHISSLEQLEIINSFSFLPLKGSVDLIEPDLVFTVYIDYINDKYYLGHLIGQGQRHLVEKFNLKKRAYLGSTSMEAELSLLIANIARIKRGQLIYDPFMGTGGLLYTAASFGALVLGSDIDGRQIRGEGRTRRNNSNNNITNPEQDSHVKINVYSNTSQYNVENKIMDHLVFDITQHPWREDLRFDAIIADPPYGIRAGAKRIGRDNKEKKVDLSFLTTEQRQERYPKTLPYKLPDIVTDLFDFADSFMNTKGMLVFWYPIEREEGSQLISASDRRGVYMEKDRETLPRDDDRFTSIARIPQYLRDVDRWLLVFEKK